MNPAIGAATLRAKTQLVKHKSRKSLRAAKPTAAPAALPVIQLPTLAEIAAGSTLRHRAPDAPPINLLPVPWGQTVALDFLGGDADDETLALFTLEVIRPVRLDGRSGVTYHWSFDQPSGDSTPDLFFASLIPGQPIEVTLNGDQLIHRHAGAWGNHRRSTVTLRAVASPKMLAQIGIFTEVRDPSKAGCLFVPVSPRQAFEIRHDGQVLVSEPAR